MTLMQQPNNTGIWVQLENEEDINQKGQAAFRNLTASEQPQRTLTFLAPTSFRHYWAPMSEVPISPYPQVHESHGYEVDWSDGEGEGEASFADDKTLDAEEPHRIEVSDKETVEIDGKNYTAEMTLAELRKACRSFCLAESGSKAKLLRRLEEFRLQLAMKMEAEVAKRLFLEQQRKPVSIKVPKLPSPEEQEQHYLTHIPFQSWCEACLASRSREDAHKAVVHDHGQALIQFDFAYTYTSESGEVEEIEGAGEPNEAINQYGTMLVAVASETKAILALPTLAKGSTNLKMIVEELVRFGFHYSREENIIYQADNERSCRQILKAIQQVRAQLGLKTEVRTSGVKQHASNGLAERGI